MLFRSFGQLDAAKVDSQGIKDRGFGEGLMQMASGILSKPTWAGGIGVGLDALAKSGAATRKEIKEAEKDARDYNFLVTKAKEAHEQGQDELMYHYADLAEKKRHNPVMEQAALITANAHATTAAAAGDKPDMQLLKMAYDHVDKQIKESIKFKNYFESLSPEDKAQYIQALALQNKQIYTGMQSPGKSGAPFVDPNAIDAELKRRGLG